METVTRELYPGERAVGFELPDIRGAFVVDKGLAPAVDLE
jgi:hypothetical protein